MHNPLAHLPLRAKMPAHRAAMHARAEGGDGGNSSKPNLL
jgi:hypothetical protein